MGSYDTDVLIVGAGPMGLTTAATLLKFGVTSFRTIDRGRDFGEGGRAVNLWARTQEILQAIDVRDHVVPRAIETDGGHLNAYGQYMGFVSFHNPTTPYSIVLSLVQSEVSRALGEQIAERGHDIEFGVELVALHADEHGVTATIRTDDAEETIRARYLVAADGGRSSVRTLMGITLEEQELVSARIHQIDAELDWAYPTNTRHWHVYLCANGQTGVIPMPNGVTRVFVCESVADAMPDRIVSCDEMSERLRTIVGDPSLMLRNPVWASYGNLGAGVVDRFVHGRVILGGDAAHKVIPVGGQGMNQAIHDGHNLGWKLALVIGADGPEELVETYDAERRAYRLELAFDQARSFQRMIEPSPEQIERTAEMAARFGSQGGGNADLPERDQQLLDVNYPRSPLSVDHLAGDVRAGDRVPDGPVVDATTERRTRRLHDILNHGGWTLLAFEADGGADVRAAMLQTLKAQVRASRRLVRRLVARSPEAIGEAVAGRPILLDLHRTLHERLEVAEPCFILVRPDGYIGFRGGLEHVGALAEYCDTFLTRPAD